jgi:hypothetical protein
LRIASNPSAAKGLVVHRGVEAQANDAMVCESLAQSIAARTIRNVAHRYHTYHLGGAESFGRANVK